MAVEFKYRSRVLNDADVSFVRQFIGQNPTASRRKLSILLCQEWNWVQPNGVLCDIRYQSSSADCSVKQYE